MQFNSFSEFIAMGHHGFYIWLSFSITLVLMVSLILLSHIGEKRVRQQIIQRERREQKLKIAAQRQKEQ